ncbi:hypothetical protein V7121_23310 [Neobacillus drentensis]
MNKFLGEFGSETYIFFSEVISEVIYGIARVNTNLPLGHLKPFLASS